MKNRISTGNEEVLWQGSPDRKVSVFESIFNGLLPLALVWSALDGFAIGSFDSIDIMTAGFFAIHLAPVWIYLFGVLTSGLKASHTAYAVTDKAVYIQRGIFSVSTERAPLNEVNHTITHVGIFDHFFGTGDVITECVHDVHKISNIRDYDQVCALIAKVSEDQYTDTMYPNDKRPEMNHGYQTRYDGWKDNGWR